MPKLLRAVRLDNSDEAVFAACGAARDGEPVTTGGFAVCDFANARRCEPSCHCEASFLAVGAKSRCTIAEVVEVTGEQVAEEVEALAWHLVRGYGAPSWEVARRVADEEVRHTVDVCESLAAGLWITVKRMPNADGTAVEEQYAVYDRLMIGAHEVG